MTAIRLLLWLSLSVGATARAAEYAPASAADAKPVARTAVADTPDPRPRVTCPPGRSAFECDRQAILAMQGEFHVRFNFEETVVLDDGYQRHPPQHSGAYETVILVRDEGETIELQHILVAETGHVTKHWRQEWVYQSPRRWQYMGDQHFEAMRTAASDRAGQWTQFVYEVNDAPRYSGTGTWRHEPEASTWTSDPSLRPLPRREYTQRHDYHLMRVVHRHTVTARGWTHEQDNTKVARAATGERALVREFGFNDYERIAGHDFKPARDYWARTAPLWAEVRARWREALGTCRDFTLRYPADEQAQLTAFFGPAERMSRPTLTRELRDQVDAWFAAQTRCVDPRLARSDR